ncbi:MAG TPA: DUF3365 domain-containing protein [Acetobacteraceae bacterium]|nr:DUF3365 domain-containing protein [Acetobacteraceae bacterium]
MTRCRSPWTIALSAGVVVLLGAASLLVAGPPAMASATLQAAKDRDVAIADSLADMLRAARTVISDNQALINNPALGDKGLDGKKVLAETLAIFRKRTGIDPAKLDPDSRQGRLLHDMMDSIVEVTDANQSTINMKGMAFKGFIPAVFARLVDEAFQRRAGAEASIKVTAPVDLVRNRKALPDAFERHIIDDKLLARSWPRGKPYTAMVMVDGKPEFRMLMPEYYDASCLACHGGPKGSLDITGYPREGRKLGDLGGVVSITLAH